MLIIGGGVIGVSILYELASRGVPATLIEANDELAQETSFANGGMLTPSMPDPWNSPGVGGHLLSSLLNPNSAMKLRPHAIPGLAMWGLQFLLNSLPERHRRSTLANYELASYSTKITDDLKTRLNLSYDDSETGTLKIFEKEAAMTEAAALAEFLGQHGLRYQAIDRAQVIEKEPQLKDVADRIFGALYFPDDRGGDARKFTLELAQRALKMGAEIRMREQVVRFKIIGDTVSGAELKSGETLSGAVVLAAGVNAPELARRAGVHLPIKPAKGYSLTFDAANLGNAAPKLAVIDDAMHAAVVPLGGRLRLVGTAEFTGVDTSIRQDRIENLFNLFRRLYPKLAEKVDRSTEMPWAGLRPMSADGRPFIGASPRKGLWLNCGHGHLGWTKAMGSARLLANQLLGEQPAIDPAPYSYRRA